MAAQESTDFRLSTVNTSKAGKRNLPASVETVISPMANTKCLRKSSKKKIEYQEVR